MSKPTSPSKKLTSQEQHKLTERLYHIHKKPTKEVFAEPIKTTKEREEEFHKRNYERAVCLDFILG